MHLDRGRYDGLLQVYYDRKDWDDRGIPTRATMEGLGLGVEAGELGDYVDLR